GAISQFQIPAADAPLKKLGEMPAASSIPHLTFGLITGNRLCTAGVGIAMFDLTAGEELKSRWSRWDDGAFSSPPEQIGEVIYCVRHSPGRGHVAAAVKVADGQPLWETPLVLSKQEAMP
ncbi:MAG TPA: hypothetical protein VMP01_26860, partial [Pirellulaceae bacterium]|nr:hypothetical protein [Pirellulaceae bacterium]